MNSLRTLNNLRVISFTQKHRSSATVNKLSIDKATSSSMFSFSLLFLPCILALQCYTGFKYMSGQSVGTEVETCPSSTDFCYNATAGLAQPVEVKMAGCSTTLCFLSYNKCISQTFQGHDLIFCCCNNGDLCNSKYTNLSTVGQVQQRLSDFLGILG